MSEGNSNSDLTGTVKPFTIYDVFGYLVPGVTLLACIYAFEEAAKSFLGAHAPLHSLLTRLSPAKDAPAFAQACVTIVAVVFTYVLGHAIAGLSSLCIDRILIQKGHGYPYEALLREPGEHTRHRVVCEREFYKGTFFWLNFAAWLFLLAALGIWPRALHYAAWIAVFSLCFAIVGKQVLKKFYPRRVNKPRPVGTDWIPPTRVELIVRVVKAFSAPYNLTASVIRSYLRSRDLDGNIAQKYREFFLQRFQMKAEDAGSNNYWLPYFYVAERSPQLARTLDGWFQQYSFARNAATAFHMAFAYMVISVWTTQTVHSKTPASATATTCLLGVARLFFSLSVLMLIRYYYLYATYYSKALFRSFVYLNLGTTPAAKLVQPGLNIRTGSDTQNHSI